MTNTANLRRNLRVIENPQPVRSSNPAYHAVRLPDVGIRWRYRERLLAIAVLVSIGYGRDIAGLVAEATAGSRTPLLALTPVLAVLIASGYRWPPAGVNDNESDWLFVAILGPIGFAGIALVTTRFETLAAMFRLDLLGAVLWTACASAILLGARHTARMWRAWLFAIIAVNPVPFSLAVGMLGGSDTAVAAVSVCYGATAVYLAGARAPRLRRLAAASVTLVGGWGLVLLLIGTLPLFGTVVAAAMVLPVTVHIGMRRWVGPDAGRTGEARAYPVRSWKSLLALVLLAFAVAAVHTTPPSMSEPASVPEDWAETAGLLGARELPDAQRFVGADARFVRYEVPTSPGMPAAAVDVITTGTLASLRDHNDTVWYPSARPLNFVPATGLQTIAPVEVRAVFSDADAAIDTATPQWYALTWDWRTDSGYQQITVIVNQNVADPATPPPAPAALEVVDTLLKPALWIGRQQADIPTTVDDIVVRRAAEIADSLLANAARA